MTDDSTSAVNPIYFYGDEGHILLSEQLLSATPVVHQEAWHDLPFKYWIPDQVGDDNINRTACKGHLRDLKRTILDNLYIYSTKF